jgi:hypothetical protein
MTKDLAACIHGLKKCEIETLKTIYLIVCCSVKEDMYLNTKDFINEVKKTLDKKLTSANAQDK